MTLKCVILVQGSVFMKFKPYKIEDAIKITEMYTLFTYTYDNTYVFSGETHDFWEFVYVIDGAITVAADSRIYNLKNGDCIFHKPMELHKFNIASENDTKLLIFSYGMEGEMVDYFKDKVFHLTQYQNGIVKELISTLKKQNADEQAHNMIIQYLEQFNKNKLFSQIVATHIHRLFLDLILYGSQTSPTLSEETTLFSRIVNYLDEHIYEYPDMEKIAKDNFISQSKLKRLFKKYSGMGVHTYFITMKMNIATKMLSDGYTVSEVASVLGFSSQAYFSKTYKKQFSISPSKVRLSNGSKEPD